MYREILILPLPKKMSGEAYDYYYYCLCKFDTKFWKLNSRRLASATSRKTLVIDE